MAETADPPEIIIPIAGEETVESTDGTETPEPKPFNKTQAEWDHLNEILTKSRKEHKEDHAALEKLKSANASESDKEWQAKVDAAQKASDDRLVRVAARAALSAAGLQGS